MRRRRRALQVSTFPFLAVLLCTMGSLILLLLVIDRRAKEAARNKALQAAMKVLDEQREAAAAQEAAREADREARRLAAHLSLEEKQAEILAAAQKLQDQRQAA